MAVIYPGMLDTLVRIERLVRPTERGKAGQESWDEVATVWANIEDVLPSRGERLADGLSMTTRPARVRMYYRDDVRADMRIVAGDRIMQIVTNPATLGRRDGIEVMAQDYSTAGPGA